MRIRLSLITLLLSVFVLSACNTSGDGQPVILVATREGPDAGFVTYKHNTDVFSIRIPARWIVDELPDTQGVRVQFSVLEENQSVVRLTAYVVNTGSAMTREAFLTATEAYQPPADLSGFEWVLMDGPNDQADGSRRLSGIRQYPLSGARALNIFMQGNGSYFAVLEVDVTDAEPETLEDLAAVVNTFRLDTSVDLTVGEVVAATTSFTGDVGFDGFLHWVDGDGGFNITGRVVNLTATPLEAIRITGYLYDSRNNQLSEKSLILSTELLGVSTTAPFRLRFEGGRPSTAVRYELHAAARIADISRSQFYGSENFNVEQNPAVYNDNGNLVLSGQLINQGTQIVQNVKVVVGVLDESGNIVAAETVFIDKNQLQPGELGNYEVVIYDVGGAPVRYELSVLGIGQ